jgi:hypothetical protein
VQEAEGVGAEGVDHGVQIDPADALERADHESVGREQLTGRSLSTRRSLKQGLSFSRKAACSGVSSMAWSAFSRSSASQRSWRVPRPLSLRIFWMVIADRRRPSSAKSAASRLQP